MKLEMFGIYDLKALCYGTPMYATTTAVGKRLFADLVNTPNSMCNKHPDDYTLNHLGFFDDGTGITTNFEHMVPLGAARTYLDTTPQHTTPIDMPAIERLEACEASSPNRLSSS